MKEPAPSVSLGHRLILLYRVSGACTEMSLLSDKAGEDGVHSVTCKYAKKKKVFLNSTSNCKEFAKPQYLQDLGQFLICLFR